MKTQKYSIQYSIENGIVILENIEVKNEYRGKGWGKKAMQRFIKMFKGKTIELHAYPQDEKTNIEKLVAFYESFGFEVVCGSESIGYEMKLN